MLFQLTILQFRSATIIRLIGKLLSHSHVKCLRKKTVKADTNLNDPIHYFEPEK